MNEMTKKNTIFRGGPVKKTLFVAALVAMLVLGLAGAAFAQGINHSGQTQFGAHGAASVIPTAVSQAAIYYPWNAAITGNVGTNSPHGNYTTTTVKCVVCHAVHYAAPLTPAGSPFGNYTVASGNQQADTLLRMRADEACIMCHATAGMAVNGRPVYDGIGPSLVNNTGGAFNTGHFTGPNCSECHTNVHGANADHSVASLDGFLLKNMTATSVQATATTTNMIQAITAIDNNAVNQGFLAGQALGWPTGTFASVNNNTLRQQAVGIFCAECHLGSYAQAGAGAAANVYQANPGSPVAYTGHRIQAAATSNWNVSGTVSSGYATGTVAWAAADNCESCHDANDIYGNIAFPHSWGGTKMWLTSASNAGSAHTNLPYGTATNSSYDNTASPTGSAPQLVDGVCLKCHVASSNTGGVGITF
jgi:hypothetical protein